MESKELFGTLFKTVPLYSEEHLEMIIEAMDSEQANYLAVQALVHSFNSGIFTLGEAEIVSKIVRILSKNTNPVNEKGEE